MNKLKYIVHVFLLWAFSFHAQDTLFLKTQKKILGKVHIISFDTVYYTLQDDNSKMEQKLLTNDLEKLIFSNGKQNHFNSFDYRTPAEEQSPRQEPEKVIFRNALSLNLIPLMNGDLALQYQRNFIKQGFSLVMPVSFMFTDYPLLTRETQNEIQIDKKNYDLGIGIYLNQKDKTDFFYIGPVFRFQEYNCRSTYTVLDYYGYPYQYVQKAVFNRYIGAITTGYFIGAANRWSCNLFFSLGYRYDKFQNNLYLPFTETLVTTLPYPGATYFWVGINLGYNF